MGSRYQSSIIRFGLHSGSLLDVHPWRKKTWGFLCIKGSFPTPVTSKEVILHPLFLVLPSVPYLLVFAWTEIYHVSIEFTKLDFSETNKNILAMVMLHQEVARRWFETIHQSEKISSWKWIISCRDQGVENRRFESLLKPSPKKIPSLKLTTNITPENSSSQKELHLPTIDFQGHTSC